MKDLDQKFRRRGIVDKKIDRSNVLELKKVVKLYGWPDRRLVGVKGELAAWLIAQHADFDIKFQKSCLKYMTASIPSNSNNYKLIAYLTDRILVNEGKRQLYGTQFHMSKDKLIPQPIKSISLLDKRRQKYRLGQMDRYATRLMRSFKKAQENRER